LKLSSALLAQTGRILALIGGVLMIVFSGLALLGFIFTVPFRSPLANVNEAGHNLIALVLGIVAIIGAKYVKKLEWAIVLIIVGYFGGGIGGLLVLIGGILGLVSRLIKYT